MKNKIFKGSNAYLVFLIIIFSIIATIINPAFSSLENLFDLLRGSCTMAILAVGFFVVLLSGGIDISFLAIAIAAQYITIKIMVELGINNVFFAFFIACIIGIILGAINGSIIAFFNFSAFIVTLGTLNLFNGAQLAFVGYQTFMSDKVPSSILDFGQKSILILTGANNTQNKLTIFILFVVIVVLVTWFILKYTMLGKGIYALGGNKEAAVRVGFNIIGTQLFVYCYMGLLAGLMGMMNASMNRMSLATSLVGDELIIIAAVVLGGAKITGGRGSIFGTLLGVMIIIILQKNLVILGIPSYWSQFFVGAIIVVSVSITSYQIKKSNSSKLLFT